MLFDVLNSSFLLDGLRSLWYGCYHLLRRVEKHLLQEHLHLTAFNISERLFIGRPLFDTTPVILPVEDQDTSGSTRFIP